ncbi:MAG: hypothetical protein UY32_C0034G0006 [Candidatus Jorgensenbacteria bacterium GW2011_GWC1_48_8]|uniref:Uncharacterized protein n=1 Tax=Candidatus Jorgensenbacteria bacterium GW2011_GWC1_48_8 TaxID=1618666 RepID=A0A0G1X679_9BACT|nr:MAG: hypothetical protein UY32_C0034G0006 [Candidatus Jorgensenbacteria bacterium GW2011_GWC1_48_8]
MAQGNYIAVEGTYLDPASNVIANPNLMTVAGAVYGYWTNKGKTTKKALMYAALWGLGARLMPIPAIAAGAVLYFKPDLLKKIF